MYRPAFTACAAIALIACNGNGNAHTDSEPATGESDALTIVDTEPFVAEEMGRFDEPWAMTFLPGGMLLITEKGGTIRFIDNPGTPGARLGTITGVPAVDYGGQGGLGDIVAHPDFAENNLLYFSYVEAGEDDTHGAVVARARLDCQEADACSLQNVETIWRQTPKVTGRGHFGHRIAFSPDGYLFISSGDRQKFDPAQDLANNLGSIVRLNDDGSVPADNPFADRGGVTAQIWSYGHRNPLGIAFAPDGRLWNIEMGPAGGDELNRVQRGGNYGYPIVSNGDHYDGRDIPDHDTRPEFIAPAVWWTPVISPGDFIFYTGALFPRWRGSVLAAGLSSKALIRVAIDGDTATEAERFDMGERIREVEQGPDGAIWLLEDQRDGSGGRLLRLAPRR